jgi:asparagine synthetase B (glutamine-hydrolysing)
MILIRGTGSERVWKKDHRQFRHCEPDIHYAVDEHEYAYEDESSIVLIDTVVDKSRRAFVDTDIGRLLTEHACGRFPPDLFLGSFFAVILNKEDRRITLVRDRSGVKTGYCAISDGCLCAGTLVHDVARTMGITSFDDETIHQVLYLDYTLDGFTYYEGVREVLVGQHLVFDADGRELENAIDPLPLATAENKLASDDIVRELRQRIKQAHLKYIAPENVVLLSGGIDSAVMAISLSDTPPGFHARAVTYRVRGTTQNEIPYAQNIAAHLGMPLETVDIDPGRNPDPKTFEKILLAMNNPYIGVWIFGAFDHPTLHTMFYAGQDTRLHTPDLNPIDRLAFMIHRLKRSRAGAGLVFLCRAVAALARPFRLVRSPSRYLRAAGRLLDIFDTDTYIRRYFFKLDRDVIRSMNLPDTWYETIRSRLAIDTDGITGSRQLYNEIVRLKWQEQYTDDIRYMQDMARLNATYVAMPFYDYELARFSSSIPFRQAAKFLLGRGRFSRSKMLIRKRLLRRAYRDRLTDVVYYRKKAVSNTIHILFNGALGDTVRDVIERDMDDPASFIAAYRLEALVARFLTNRVWRMTDDTYLLKIYYLAALCIYNRRILRAEASSEEPILHPEPRPGDME